MKYFTQSLSPTLFRVFDNAANLCWLEHGMFKVLMNVLLSVSQISFCTLQEVSKAAGERAYIEVEEY